MVGGSEKLSVTSLQSSTGVIYRHSHVLSSTHVRAGGHITRRFRHVGGRHTFLIAAVRSGVKIAMEEVNVGCHLQGSGWE